MNLGTQVKHNLTGEIGVVIGMPVSPLPNTITVDFKKFGVKQNQPVAAFTALVNPKKPILEWTDPGTGDVHTCPAEYVPALQKHLGKGIENAMTSTELLKFMGEQDTESNKRHIRAAAFYLKKHGSPVISFRSGKGGYFIAVTKEEVTAYVTQQHKLADSMKFEADALALAFA